MNILIRIYLRRILELVSCGICKWLCNSAFRFCSSTNGYATLHFDFVHRQMAMQLYISILFINKMAMQLYISVLFINKMVMQLYISVLFIDKMVMQLCNSILFIDKMVMQLCISVLFIDKMVKQLCNALCRFCMLPLSIATAIFLSIPHKYYLCTREILMTDEK
jgi:hypothetical protein